MDDDLQTYRRQFFEGDVSAIDPRLLHPLAVAWQRRAEGQRDPAAKRLAERQARAFFDAAVERLSQSELAPTDGIWSLLQQRAEFVAGTGDVDAALQGLAEHANGPEAGPVLNTMAMVGAKYGRPEVVSQATLRALREHGHAPGAHELPQLLPAMDRGAASFLLESMVRNQQAEVRRELADVEAILRGEVWGTQFHLGELRKLHLLYADLHERADGGQDAAVAAVASAHHRAEAARLAAHPLLAAERHPYADVILEDVLHRTTKLDWGSAADELRARVADGNLMDAIQVAYAEVFRVATGAQPDIEAGLAEADRYYQIARRSTYVDGPRSEGNAAASRIDQTWCIALLDGAASARSRDVAERLMAAHEWAVASLDVRLPTAVRFARALRRHAIQQGQHLVRDPMELGAPSREIFTEMLQVAIMDGAMDTDSGAHGSVIRWMEELEREGRGDEVRQIIDALPGPEGRGGLRKQFYAAWSKLVQADLLNEMGGADALPQARRLQQESLASVVGIVAQQRSAVPPAESEAALRRLLCDPAVGTELREDVVRGVLAVGPAPSAIYLPWSGPVDVALSYLDARRAGAVPNDGTLSDAELLSLSTETVLRHGSEPWDIGKYSEVLIARREFGEVRSAIDRWRTERTDIELDTSALRDLRMIEITLALAQGDVGPLRDLMAEGHPWLATLRSSTFVEDLQALPNLPLASTTRPVELAMGRGEGHRAGRRTSRRVVLFGGGEGVTAGTSALRPLSLPTVPSAPEASDAVGRDAVEGTEGDRGATARPDERRQRRPGPAGAPETLN